MKIAITGATGKLGNLVISQLLEKGGNHQIIAMVRDKDKAKPLADKGAEVRVAAYNDPDALNTALAGVDKVLLISSSEVGQRVEQHKNVIEAAKASGVKHFVYTSASRATTTDLIVAPEHKATEEMIHASGLTYTILRNNWYTENYLAQIETARNTGELVAAVGDGKVASATRADFAAGAVAVLLGEGHDGKTYELAGDHAWDYNELAQAIGEIIGKPVAYKAVDAQTLTDSMIAAGLDEGMAGFTVALDQNIASGALAEVTGDLSRIIGRPTTTLKQGLMDALS